jgi:hypothetical protein
MPFDRLETDERLEASQKPGPDMDTVMLAGCSTFVGVSVTHYTLAVWPFLVFPAIYQLSTLALCGAVGGIPALGVSVWATRRFGLAAAAGAIGGSCALAIFLFLRLNQYNLVRSNPDFPQIEYPEAWAWAIPFGWTLLVVALVVVFLKAGEIGPE